MQMYVLYSVDELYVMMEAIALLYVHLRGISSTVSLLFQSGPT